MHQLLSKNPTTTVDVLRSVGLRATEQRIAVYDILIKKKCALSIPNILSLSPVDMNESTAYRIIEQFVEKELVRKMYFQTGKTFFEIMSDHHHHHIVCTQCHDVEPVSACVLGKNIQSVTRGSHKFSTIADHMLEFFGTCKTCTRKK
ncbi:MAG: transcriptional repressor [Candidatus Pacebacteria bacterium]|nr:transcriptional repressor [Candidatus Paceibacterota bacterium]